MGGDYFSFVNLEDMSVVVLPSDTLDSDTLLRIPTIDELCPYGVAMHSFLTEKKLSVPDSISAKSFVIENNLYYDFLDFRE